MLRALVLMVLFGLDRTLRPSPRAWSSWRHATLTGGEPLDEKPARLVAFENRDPAVVKKGSVRRRRKDAILADRRAQVAGVVAGLERAEGEMADAPP